MVKYLKLSKMGLLLILIFGLSMFVGCTSIDRNGLVNKLSISDKDSNENMRVLNYDDVKNSLIRFHVIANSDSNSDQKLKIKVKNQVIEYLYPYLNNSQSLDESRQIIMNKMSDVKSIAENVIKDSKYKYDVRVQLSRENFPDKSYGNITLPQGNYEAFRIIIGDGKGQNWWCVMFPPLCFVDESKAQVEYDKTENEIQANGNNFDLGNKEEYLNSEKNDQKDKEDANESNIKLRFKIIDILKDIFK